MKKVYNTILFHCTNKVYVYVEQGKTGKETYSAKDQETKKIQ